MNSLLDVVNTKPDKFLVGELPIKSGDVSIMTLEELYMALGGSTFHSEHKKDPTKGYNTSTYFIYAINDIPMHNDGLTNSTLDNLEEVCADWYKNVDQHKPTDIDHRWAPASHILFGGPLHYIYRFSDGTYIFSWFYSKNPLDDWDSENCWGNFASGNIHVAVVHS